MPEDFVLISAAWMLDREVTTYDEDNRIIPDDGSYQRRGAEIVYVFGEFLRDKQLLQPGVTVSRTHDFKLMFSALTEEGQAFTRAALDKWVKSLDRAPGRPVDSSGLEKRWKKFKSE